MGHRPWGPESDTGGIMSNSILGKTPSQTIGPFFKFGTEWIASEDLARHDDPNSIELSGTVFDGAGNPVADAMIEICQADENGKFPPDTKETWIGWARRLTDENGGYRIRTIVPGVVETSSGEDQAPHMLVVVFARGLLRPVFTRIYFPDHADANSNDPLLSALDDEAKGTMLAVREGPGKYRFDVRLQDSHKGPETKFIQFGS